MYLCCFYVILFYDDNMVIKLKYLKNRGNKKIYMDSYLYENIWNIKKYRFPGIKKKLIYIDFYISTIAITPGCKCFIL